MFAKAPDALVADVARPMAAPVPAVPDVVGPAVAPVELVELVELVAAVVVVVGAPELELIKKGAENTFGAVKSFWFWPTYNTQKLVWLHIGSKFDCSPSVALGSR